MKIVMKGYESTLSRAPWRAPLRTYLRALHISDDGREEDRALIARTIDALKEMPDGDPRTYSARPDLSFTVHRRGPVGTILLRDALTGERIGGAFRGLPLIFQEFRGEGLGAEIVCFSDLERGFGLEPGRYSESGFRARVSAHRRHVERAMRWCPQDVPEDVLREYRISPGGQAHLAEPWGRHEHEKWIRGLKNE